MCTIQATIATNQGDIRLNLFHEQAPITVANFIHLAQSGFYTPNQFHRVVNDFVIQGGCPLGNGTGGPGYRFQDEFTPELTHHKAGILSMANAGPGTNGSQFFITLNATPHLDQRHSVFGEVDEACMDVVHKISQGDVIQSITITGDTTEFMAAHQAQTEQWSKALQARA